MNLALDLKPQSRRDFPLSSVESQERNDRWFIENIQRGSDVPEVCASEIADIHRDLEFIAEGTIRNYPIYV